MKKAEIKAKEKAYRDMFNSNLSDDLIIYADKRCASIKKRFIEFGLMYIKESDKEVYWKNSNEFEKRCCKFFLAMVSGLDAKWILYRQILGLR